MKSRGTQLIRIFLSFSRTPVRTMFEPHPQGVVAMAMTADAKFLAMLSAGDTQVSYCTFYTFSSDDALTNPAGMVIPRGVSVLLFGRVT